MHQTWQTSTGADEGDDMADLSNCNSTARFTGLAEGYAKHRPSYPSHALDFIQNRCELGPHSLLVDIGCGTGISSRLFAERGVQVVGIDPNDEMRRQAELVTLRSGYPAPVYRNGRAEETGLTDRFADAVLAAQAFHWFAAEAAFREFRRILKPGGWVVLMWHERDENDPCTADYGQVIRSTPDAAAVELPRGRAGDTLLTSPLFQHSGRFTFPNEQRLDVDGLLGRAFSASYAPREPAQAHAFSENLRAVFTRWQHNGVVTLRYETSVYLGRSPA
jgi:SAM-dependent methyltransferase